MRRWSVLQVLLFAGFSAARGEPRPAAALPPVRTPSPLTTLSALLADSRKVEQTDPGESFRLASQALDIAQRKREEIPRGAALLQMGKISAASMDYTRAATEAEEGYAIAVKENDDALRGECSLLLGSVRAQQGFLPEAETYLRTAEKISQGPGQEALRVGTEEALGRLASRNGDPNATLAHLNAAANLADKTHDPHLASILTALGDHYLAEGDRFRAEDCYARALPLARAGGNKKLLLRVLLTLGHLAHAAHDVTAAQAMLTEAIAIGDEFHQNRAVAEGLCLLATLEREAGHLDVAEANLRRSLELAQRDNAPGLLATIYSEYAATVEAEQNYQQALEFTRKLGEQQAALRAEDARQQLLQLTSARDAEARAKQIKILQRDRELDQATLALQSAEMSRTRSRYSAVALALVLLGLGASAFAGRQRSRARRASLALAETRAAKEQAEQADANKARLLTIAAHSLEESEARFRNAFDLSPLGMALVGLDGRWLRVNSALCQITGYEEAELLATDFQAITHPDDLTTDLKYVGQLLRGEIETYQMEKRYIRKNGLHVWIRLDVSLLREAGTREPRCFISQVQDITARRHDEELLTHAKEEAERANTAKSEFLSRMSHELRTPLNAILGFTQLLEIEELNSQANQSVGQILTASRHLLHLIDEVLDISTIECGQFAICLEPIDVGEAVRGAIGLVRPLSEEATVQVIADGCEQAGYVMADARRLRQVLLNLLSNGIKYNRSEGSVTVSCRSEEGTVCIDVNDTGVGIAQDDLETIFIPFSRLPNTQEIAGSGIGLSLSKALTEAMQGTLSVRSTEARGSTFTICLPPATKCLRPDTSDLELALAAGNFFEPSPHEKATVLYIEDNAGNLELVQRILAKNQALHLISAPDGRSGLAMAEKHQPDVILLDVHLRDIPGSEVLLELRRRPALAEVPVIVVSADVSSEQIEKMKSLGIAEYLRKPFDIKDLRRAISDALQTPASF